MASGRKILITGATGQVAGPVAWELAKTNEVWCLGRFGDAAIASDLERRGIRLHRWDMGKEDLTGLPTDFTHVFHAAALRDTDDFEAAIHVNTVGTGMLMNHCRNAEAFIFVSSFAVYKFIAPEHDYAETDPLGGHTPWMPAYAPSKISTEGVVRAMARTLGLPSVIARLNTAYGPAGHGGVPIRFFKLMLEGKPIVVPRHHLDWNHPIHTDDIARQLPLLWAHAKTTPPIMNWAGDEKISVTAMMNLVAEMTGVPVRFEPSDITRSTFASDNTRRQAMIGMCKVSLEDGLRRTLRAHFPTHVKGRA